MPTAASTRKTRSVAPKRIAAGDQPSQNTTEVTIPKATGESTVDTVIDPKPKLKKKAPLPARDPLPAREGRNTHPGLHIGIQPTPRQSAQAIAAEHEKKRQALEEKQHALEAKLQGIEEAKDVLAQMELEDESLKEEVEEQGRQRLPNPFAPYHESSGDEEFEGWDDVEDITDDNIEEDIVDDDLEPEPEVVEVQGRGKGKGRKASSRELCKDVKDKADRLRVAGGKKVPKQQVGEARFNFSLADLLPKKYNKAGADATTMDYFVPEPVIGGLDDDYITAECLASFGPIASQAMPIIPLDLQQDCTRANNDHPRAGATNNRLQAQASSNKAVKRAKLRIRVRPPTQHQGKTSTLPPAMGIPLLCIPDAGFFLRQPTWAKVFIPSVMYLFFISEHPFQTFVNNSMSFVAIVQEAFNAAHPTISHKLTAGDDIVTTLVKTYFEAAMFVDQSKEIKRHVWWALRPDGLTYNAKPTPIGCAFEPKSPHYIRPQGRYQSAVIIPITKKFLALANGSAILPTIGAQNPPIGLYILILTAVERAYKSFIT
ncbi:hypothetical protein EI94DRAFT_1707407, partial [Lactarius quietus]